MLLWIPILFAHTVFVSVCLSLWLWRGGRENHWRSLSDKEMPHMIRSILSSISPPLNLNQCLSVLVMHHRFLPISMERGCLSAARAWCRVGRKASCNHGGQLPDSSHQLTPLGTSAHSSLHQDALIYRLHIQSFISLSSSLLSLFSLFLIFFSKPDPTLSSQAWLAAVSLLKEQRNDLISHSLCLCGLLSLLIHRSLHTKASFSSPCEGSCRALTSQPRHGHCWRSIPVVRTEHAVPPK